MNAEDSPCLRNTGPAPGFPVLEKWRHQSVSAEPDGNRNLYLTCQTKAWGGLWVPKTKRTGLEVFLLGRASPRFRHLSNICRKENYYCGFKSSLDIAECPIGPEEATPVGMKVVLAVTWPSTVKEQIVMCGLHHDQTKKQTSGL